MQNAKGADARDSLPVGLSALMLTDWPTAVPVVLRTSCSVMLVRRSFGSRWKRHETILGSYGKPSDHFYTWVNKASGSQVGTLISWQHQLAHST